MERGETQNAHDDKEAGEGEGEEEEEEPEQLLRLVITIDTRTARSGLAVWINHVSEPTSIVPSYTSARRYVAGYRP